MGSCPLFALIRRRGREIIVAFTIGDQADDLEGSGGRDRTVDHGLPFSCHGGSGSAGGGSIMVAETSARESPRGRCRGERVGADKDDVVIFVKIGLPLGLDMGAVFEGKLAFDAGFSLRNWLGLGCAVKTHYVEFYMLSRSFFSADGTPTLTMELLDLHSY